MRVLRQMRQMRQIHSSVLLLLNSALLIMAADDETACRDWKWEVTVLRDDTIHSRH